MSVHIEKTANLENDAIVHPTLHHYAIKTARVEQMGDWYGKVLGMTIVLESSAPLGKSTPPSLGLRAVWMTNDQANHRLALLSSGMTDDSEKAAHAGVQHVAFEHATIDDLLNAYLRLKQLGIEPIYGADHGRRADRRLGAYTRCRCCPRPFAR